MQGTIIALGSARTADIYAQGKIYQTKLSPDLAEAWPGDQVSCRELVSPSCGKKGTVQVSALAPLSRPQKLAWSQNRSIKDHVLQETNSGYLLAAEAADYQTCYQLLAQKALSCNANALLDVTGCGYKRPFAKRPLCRLTALPAQISGPDFQPKPGLHLNLPEKFSRRNSPNGAQLRYVRVLLICLLLILEPCLARLGATGSIPLLASQILMAVLPIFCLIYALIYNPCRAVVYLLRHTR